MASRELYGQRRTLDLLWSRHCGRGNCFHRGLTALIVANLARHQRRPIKFIKPVTDGRERKPGNLGNRRTLLLKGLRGRAYP